MSADKEYSVNWKNHMNHVRQAFDHLLTSNELVDVTLCCEGKKVSAHKILLSACSLYFRDIFKEVPCQHPVIILYGIEYAMLTDILHFIYNGEVSVDTSKLEGFLKTAQLLQISGLTNGIEKFQNSQQNTTEVENIESTIDVPTRKTNTKRRRKSTEESVHENVIIPTEENEEMIFISDVKCEPRELITFDDALADPLQDDLPQSDPNALYEHVTVPLANTTNQEDLKSTAGLKTTWPANTVKCNICDKVFSHPYSLQQHKSVHAGSTRCPICNVVLSRKYQLKSHMKSKHNHSTEKSTTETENFTTDVKRRRKSTEEESGHENVLTQTEEIEDTIFITDVKCEPRQLITFNDTLEDPLDEQQQSDPKGLHEHVTLPITTNQVLKSAARLKTPWPIHTIKCNICDKVFSHPYSLQQHKPVHAGTTRCSICNAVLSRKYHLKLHMKSRHNLK